MLGKRGLNRKGDVTISTVILIVLGLAVLVFLVVGFTKGFDVFFGNLDTIDPGKLEVIYQACKGYASAELRAAYCEYRELGKVSGDTIWINCNDKDIQNLLRGDGVSFTEGCSGKDIAFCNNAANKDRTKINIALANGERKLCKDIVGTPPTVADTSVPLCTPNTGGTTPVSSVPCKCGNSATCTSSGQICDASANSGAGECKTA